MTIINTNGVQTFYDKFRISSDVDQNFYESSPYNCILNPEDMCTCLDTPPFGSCCDILTGACIINILESNCPDTREWYYDNTCIERSVAP